MLKLENSRQSLPPTSAASSADRRLSCSLPLKRVFRAPATWQPRAETQAKGRFTCSRSPMRLSHERDERRIAWVTDDDCKTGSGDLRPRYAIIGSILTLALFREPLKRGALLGRRIKYQSFDVLNRAAGFAAARHGRGAGFEIPRGRSAAQILFWSKALRPACSRSDHVSRPTCRRGGALAGHLLNAEDHRRREERLDRASLSASAVGISLRGRTER